MAKKTVRYSGWKIKDEGSWLSQKVGKFEVTIERLNGFYRVSIWKGEQKDWVEEQDIEGIRPESEYRAITLGNQLVKQLHEKSH